MAMFYVAMLVYRAGYLEILSSTPVSSDSPSTAGGIYVLVIDLSSWLEAASMPGTMCSDGLPLELSEPRTSAKGREATEMGIQRNRLWQSIKPSGNLTLCY